MAQYTVRDPQGQEHIIEGPDNATPDEVIAQAQNLIPSGDQGSQSAPYGGTWLENAGQAVQGVLDKAGPAIEASNRLQDIVTPGAGIPRMAIGAAGELLNRAGEFTAETAGRMGANPYVGGALGMGVANAPMFMLPGRPIEGSALRPEIPAARQFGVQAAREAAVPLSRAEQTGGRFLTGLENFTERTPMGGIPMSAARREGDAAMQTYKESLQAQMGTPKENFDVGYQAKPAMADRQSAMNQIRQEKFNAVPEDVHIPLNNSQNVADQIIQEQSQYLPTTRNGDVLAIAKDVQNAHEGISSGGGVTGGPEVKGVTTIIPASTVPAKTITQTSSLAGPRGEPLTYKETIPGKTIPESTEYGVKYSVGPEQTFTPKPNYQLLKRLRETLTGKAQEARTSGNMASERDYLRLKSAINDDIQAYVTSSADTQFSKSYSQANAFSGAYKQLFQGDLAAKIEEAPPEKILGMVFQKNNETAIKKFHALVGDESFQVAKRKWVNDLLDSPNVSKALSDKKIDPGTLNAILSKPEQEALMKYGAVQELRKTAEQLQGTHGSARMTGHALSYGAALDAAYSMLHGDLARAATMGTAFAGPYGVGKALTSQAAREGLSMSIPGGLGTAAMAELISRMNTRKKGGQ